MINVYDAAGNLVAMRFQGALNRLAMLQPFAAHWRQK
jgi:hypothetical protein